MLNFTNTIVNSIAYLIAAQTLNFLLTVLAFEKGEFGHGVVALGFDIVVIMVIPPGDPWRNQ